jgi:tetratricopeptide (TPR) repeat protein
MKARDNAIRLAKQHANRATERERLWIESRYALFIDGDRDTSMARLKELVARYPEDKVACFWLGFTFQSRRQVDEAVHWYERALALDPTYGPALNSLAFAYLDSGKPDLAVQCLEKYVATSPGEPNPLDSLGWLQLMLGRLDNAASTLEQAVAINPGFGSYLPLAIVAALKEDYATAFRWTDSLAGHATSDGTRAEADGMRAILFQLTGRANDARGVLRSYREISTRGGTAYRADLLKVWVEFDNGAWTEARNALESAREGWKPTSSLTSGAVAATYAVALATIDQAERSSRVEASDVEQLQATVAAALDLAPLLALGVLRVRAAGLAAEGRVDEAITVLQPAWPGPVRLGSSTTGTIPNLIRYTCPLQQDELARLYVRKGDWDRAIAEYKVLTVIGPEHTNRRFVHPLYHYRLAQVCEKKSMRAEAIAEYRKFLKLWERADTPRPEIRDARARLASLERSSGAGGD